MPTRAFGAPQTICSSSPCPASTLRPAGDRLRCFSVATISATTTRCSPRPARSVLPLPARPWSAWPVRVARSALISTSSRSQFSENFLIVCLFEGRGTSSVAPKSMFALIQGLRLATRPHPRFMQTASRSAGRSRRTRADWTRRSATSRSALYAQAEREAGIALRIDTVRQQSPGCTMPQPSTSSQRVEPSSASQRISTSADGSVNGK